MVTEALRGEGAKLMNHKNEYFMERYSPKQKDLAPRDEVARAIFNEIECDNSGYVYLDTRCIKNIDISKRFPTIYNKCKSVGIDISKDPIPVVPAAHYFCGGIKVDSNAASSLDGLFSVGESACTGVHGANRLASVSLLEGLYFGIRCGNYISKNLNPISDDLMKSIPGWVTPKTEIEFDPVLIKSDLYNIQNTMWNYAGIIRTKNRLIRAISDLGYINHRIEKFYREARITRDLIELRNSVLTANLIAKAAHGNSNSIGCHFIQK